MGLTVPGNRNCHLTMWSAVFKTTSTTFRRSNMAWNKPVITEISVGLEINSYACAEK
tara:strand:+ start:132 stop:302 length:171 start_codon:yes stop_codon:yes gene_type:complete